MTLPHMTSAPVYPHGRDRPVASVSQYLLDKIVEMYAAEGTPLPTRRYLTVGAIAPVDDEQLVVMYGGLYTGTPGNELTSPVSNRGTGWVPRSATINVELWRKYPGLSGTGRAPRPEAMQEAAMPLMHDSWLLLEAAFAADQLQVGVIANAGVSEPQGDYAGVSMIVELQVP
jgi:hypothetical protein